MDKRRHGVCAGACLLLLAGCFLASPTRQAGAETLESDPARPRDAGALSGGYFGEGGISFRGASLEIKRKGSDVVLTTMESELRPTLTLSLQTPPRYFGDWPIGYVLVYGLGSFSIDTQDTPFGFDQENLGTSVDGFFLFCTPTLVFDPTRIPGQGTAGVRLGIGLGLGYISAEGDFLHWDTAAPYPYPQFRDSIDVSSLAIGGYVFSEYLVGRLVFGLHAGFFDAYGGAYDFIFADYSIDVGWRSEF